MSLRKLPLVTVCIPTFQGGSFIQATIDSVLNQSYENFELCIVDDNSPDDTEAIISRYDDKRIKYFRNHINLGPERNWNKCLELAHGKYFKLLPHDDLLACNSIKQQVSVFESDKPHAIALVFGIRKVIDPSGRALMIRKPSQMNIGRICGADLIKHCIRAGTNQIGEPGNVLFRSELIKKVGNYDASFPYVTDLDFCFRILQHGDGYYTATHSSSFRLLPDSWSVAIGTNQYRDFKAIVDKYSNNKNLKISYTDRQIGIIKARMFGHLRTLVYLWLFRVRSMRPRNQNNLKNLGI